MSEHGGTVTYHRAEYNSGDDTWRVWFRPTGGYYAFGGAEGAAMGLTAPDPAPLVVECRGHRIELSDLDADVFQRTWAERATYDIAYDRACDKLARLLRDARQDPQPTVDTPSDDIEQLVKNLGYAAAQLGGYGCSASKGYVQDAIDVIAALGDAARGGA